MAAPSREILTAREAEIKTLVGQDKREEAGKTLFDLIVSCVKGGDLKNAARLRDWFYEVNPMALSAIIKVNEMIDEAMSGSINETFAQAWTGLKKILSDEEFSSLYHCLEEHRFEAGKQIVKAGSKLDAVMFISLGNVNVNCLCGGKNATVKVLEPGMMISENCFEPSCWTASLTALSPVTLSILRHEQLMELYDRFPGIDSRLTAYCEKFNDISRLLLEQGLNRRRHERLRIDQKIIFQSVDKDGRAGERTYRGELDTLSRGGLSFVLRMVKRENRRMLFGRRLLVTLENEGEKVEFTGVVVAITIYDFQEHDYAVRIAFDKELSEELVAALAPPIEEELEIPDEMDIPSTEEGENT